jgi:hypothetical protein
MKPSDARSTFIVNRWPFWVFVLALVLFGALALAFGLGKDEAAVFMGALFGGLGLVGVAILTLVPAKRITLAPDALQLEGRNFPYDRLHITPVEVRDVGDVSARAFDIQVLDPSGQKVASIAINDRRWRDFDRLHAALLEAVRERRERGGRGAGERA